MRFISAYFPTFKVIYWPIQESHYYGTFYVKKIQVIYFLNSLFQNYYYYYCFGRRKFQQSASKVLLRLAHFPVTKLLLFLTPLINSKNKPVEVIGIENDIKLSSGFQTWIFVFLPNSLL